MESRRAFARRAFTGIAIGAALPLRAEPTDAAAKRLQAKFIAPCCWAESVAVHRSETAAEMRVEIAHLLEAGQSEEQITALYVSKYGERILLEPRGQKLTWLTVIPIAALAAGGVSLAKYLKRPRPEPVAASAPAAQVTVPDDELEW